MALKVEKLTECVTLGEGPHWDESQQCLYFVSIPDKTIHKYVPATKEYTKTTVDGRVGFIVPVEGTINQFVIGLERKFVIIQWDGKNNSPVKVVKEIAEVDEGLTTRINDAKADPRGRIYGGTMGNEESPGNFEREKGSLYRIDRGTLTKLDEKISISNGLAWDLKEKAFYYTDSLERNIRRYDYDVDTGDISNKKYIFDFKTNNIEGVPDGTTIDERGNLWTAVFGGGAVLNVDPRTGTLLHKVAIPAKQVTSVTFGGKNYDTLFVTTACVKIDSDQPPPSGATFMITGLGVRGLPNVSYKM